MWLDPRFWGNHFTTVFSKQITVFCDSVAKRVLPAFDQIDVEAESLAEEEYNRFGSLPANEYLDEADVVERALEAGLAYYQAMEAVRQALLNIAAAALYHLFEQQLLFFHRRQILHPAERNDTKLITLRELKDRLIEGGIDIELLPSWTRVDELRAIANAIKHAEGPSADRLRSLRPDLFIHPTLRDKDTLSEQFRRSLHLPLAGQDIYVATNDIEEYGSALISFWCEFGEAIQSD